MKPITSEWIAIAEEDWHAMMTSHRARKHHTYSVTCVQAKRCVEEYLKARSAEAEIAFAKTHDLHSLLTLSKPLEPAWEAIQPELDALNKYSIEYNYPGKWATETEARQAVKDCRKVRGVIRTAFGLPV